MEWRKHTCIIEEMIARGEEQGVVVADGQPPETSLVLQLAGIKDKDEDALAILAPEKYTEILREESRCAASLPTRASASEKVAATFRDSVARLATARPLMSETPPIEHMCCGLCVRDSDRTCLEVGQMLLKELRALARASSAALQSLGLCVAIEVLRHAVVLQGGDIGGTLFAHQCFSTTQAPLPSGGSNFYYVGGRGCCKWYCGTTSFARLENAPPSGRATAAVQALPVASIPLSLCDRRPQARRAVGAQGNSTCHVLAPVT